VARIIEHRINGVIMFIAKKISTISYYQEKVQLVKNEILTRLNTELSIPDLADCACTSYHHLCNIFLQIEGMPLKQFITNLRVEVAAELLGSTEMRLNEIAYRVGYVNKSTLSKAFKRKYNVAPGEYRRSKRYEELLSKAA